MSYYFLTAMRNESRTIPAFLQEISAVVDELSLRGRLTLAVVDDYSLDGSAELVERLARELTGVTVVVIRTPTNLGNQGALCYGLQNLDIGPADILVTFDSDGEDDVRSIPSIIALGLQAPGRAVVIERARRHEGFLFRALFWGYKLLYRYLTGNAVVPNNFLLLPGATIPAIKRSALVAAHFSYGVLRIGIPYVATSRDRRSRYAGRSSQSAFTLISHGLVGLMVFFETVLGKLFFLGCVTVFSGMVTVFVSSVMPETWQWTQALFLLLAVAAGGGGLVLLNLMVAAALALAFKILLYQLNVGINSSCRAQPTAPDDKPTTDHA